MFDIKEISTEVEDGASADSITIFGAPQHKSRKGGKATNPTLTKADSPSQIIPQAVNHPITSLPVPADTSLSGQALSDPQQIAAAQTPLPSHVTNATQRDNARQTLTDHGPRKNESHNTVAVVGEPIPSQGHSTDDNQSCTALVGEITAIYRRYEDLRRARQRLELQAMATCRIVCEGDKVAGMKLYKSPTPEVDLWLDPYRLAMEPLTTAIKTQEKLLTKLGKQLPVKEWADTVPGLSPRFLAAIIGECGIGPGEFKSVSALWKRMGMAVINGGRQRRVTGDAAIEHGYVARRRALMWNIGDQVAVRQAIRNPKDEDGKPTGAVAINEWGELYLERKAYELAREIDGKPITPMHAHNRAKRYVEKRLLKQLWQQWRKVSG